MRVRLTRTDERPMSLTLYYADAKSAAPGTLRAAVGGLDVRVSDHLTAAQATAFDAAVRKLALAAVASSGDATVVEEAP